MACSIIFIPFRDSSPRLVLIILFLSRSRSRSRGGHRLLGRCVVVLAQLVGARGMHAFLVCARGVCTLILWLHTYGLRRSLSGCLHVWICVWAARAQAGACALGPFGPLAWVGAGRFLPRRRRRHLPLLALSRAQQQQRDLEAVRGVQGV